MYKGSGNCEGVIQEAQDQNIGPSCRNSVMFFQELIHGISKYPYRNEIGKVRTAALAQLAQQAGLEKKKISLLRDLNYSSSIITNAHDSLHTSRVYLRKNDSRIVSFPLVLMICSVLPDLESLMAMNDCCLAMATSLSVSAS